MNGRALLEGWMRRLGVTGREAAQQIGLHYTDLSKILCGRRTPGLQNALKIERATGIPVEAWVPTLGGTAVRRRQTQRH